jgi:hypothetical protein
MASELFASISNGSAANAAICYLSLKPRQRRCCERHSTRAGVIIERNLTLLALFPSDPGKEFFSMYRDFDWLDELEP